MAGEEPEVRKKHHRSSEDGAEEGSKRRKHSHHHRSHRHHHHRRHRSSKPDDETKHEEQDLEISSPQREIPPIVAPNSNSITRLDDDKEEGEILDEEDYGVANGELAKKKEDSDVESGEIKFEAFEELEHRNPRVRDEDDEEDNSSGRRKETELEIVLPLENDTVSISPANRRGDTEFVIQGVSDGKDAKEMRDEVDISKYLRIEHSVSSEKDYETGETDTESGKLRDSKGVRQHRDRTSRRANGVSHRSRKGDKRTERLSVSPLQKREMEVNNRNIESRHGRSRSPDHEEDVDLRKHQRVDDIDFEGLDIVRHGPRKHSESVDIERRSYGDRRKSVSPESMGDKFPTVDHSPYHHRNHEGDKARKRSRSRDHARERRSQSRSYLQDDRVHHMDLDYRSRTDSSSRMESLASREKARNEYDHPRVVRHDREDRHVTRDWARDRERERSSSYSRYGRREDRHGSRDPREKERERESDKNRDRDKGRGIDNDRHRDSGRDRNRERERDNLNLDGYRDSRRSQLSERGYHHDRRSKYQSNDLEEGEDNLKRDADEQEDYEEKVELKLASEEEDIARIKEESRKRREAILEKYRRQNHEKQGERQYEDSEIETKDSLSSEKPIERGSPVKVELSSAPEGPAGRNNGLEECDAVPMFAIGKSPLQNGPVAFERAPGTGGLGDGTPKSERSEDMFCDDIFGESPAGVRKAEKGEGLQIERSGLNDNWDDADGYYIYRFGELLDGRYEITAAHGKGVFSSVVRAKDLKAAKGEPEEVAIKIIRNNETMYKTGLEELVILKKLVGADPEDRRHCVRYISSFKYRNHLCLVFESLHMNLREVLKKFGRNIGLSLKAVREYAKQLFVSLKHLRNCGVLHCDIKPDNMLVSESKRVLKLCDFGNAMFAGRNEITPYLVSRFYRAPEIILGLTYDHPMDIWSVGCCLYELYSGKVLFPGPTNNDMLRLHMELKGPFPKKMLRKGAFTDQHFDNDLNFCAEEVDPVTKKIVKRLLSNIKPKDFSAIITGSPGEDPKMLANFKDLLEKIFVLDPEKRVTVSQALNHPFITGK